MPEIQSMSIKHDALLTFIMANPAMPLGQVAAHFNVSQPWLSCIIHSDIFQKRLRERQDLVFHHTLMPIAEKLTHLAHASLDRLTESIESGQMAPSEVRKTAADVLAALGYSTKGGVTQIAAGQGAQINNYVVDRELLATARERIAARNRGGNLIEHNQPAGALKGFMDTLPQGDPHDGEEAVYASTAEELPGGGQRVVGEAE